jgi:hypothetical protein
MILPGVSCRTNSGVLYPEIYLVRMRGDTRRGRRLYSHTEQEQQAKDIGKGVHVGN